MSRFAFMNNPYRVIKGLVFVTGFCIASCTTALAQQSLYVYLQSENTQPFYVQMDDKVYSSSAIGHLVISGLPDKTCNLEIGFPQHATQPQRFSVPLRNKDHGFQLVKNGSRGWALQDLQTDETIKPLKEAGNSSLLYGERKNDDAFATLMAAVVNDSAVLYTSIVRKEMETVPTVANTETRPAENQPQVKVEEKAVQPKDTAVSEKKVEAVTVTSTPTAPDSPSQVKNEPTPTRDSGAVTQKENTADTLTTKYTPQERALTEKPVQAGVAKIQQQTKDGETKMVFVDSSETPVKVVTVYINADTPAANVVKSEAKQEPVVKDSVKTAAVPAQNKEVIAEQIKKETWRAVPEKKPSTTDTVTIILESPQMKKSTNAVEEPKPLFRPKEEKQPEPVKPVTRDTVVMQLFDPGKMDVTTDKGVVKQEPVKPVEADSLLKKETEPVKKDKEEPAKETPKAVLESKPVVDTVKKAVTEPVVSQKETTTAVVKPAEPEKKAEVPGKLVMINSDCVKLASDNDVDKMRVKMMAEGDPQKRLTVANKYFKTMCLYARQIKALSELFSGDEAKYKFLELAYPFAADTATFKQLYELLTDEVYVTRFKKLVRLQ